MKKREIFHIFLDVDGVLNTKAQWGKMYYLDDKCIKRFGLFAQRMGDCRVILSSSWRNGFSYDGNHAKHVKELILLLNQYGVQVEGKTPVCENGDRAKEIASYIRMKQFLPEKCIIVDDDKSIFKSALPYGCKILWQDEQIGFLDIEENSNFPSCFKNLFGRIFSKIGGKDDNA